MYKRRLKVFLSLMALGVVVLVGRLVQLQLVQGQEFRQQADELLTYGELLPTARGQILDRKDRVLAYDQACFDFCLDYAMLTEDERWLARRVREISRREGLDADRAEALLRRRIMGTWRLAAEITGATWNDMARAAEDTVARVRAIGRIVGGPVREENRPHPVVAGLDEEMAAEIRARLGEMVGACVRPSHRRWYPYGEAACHVIGVLGEAAPGELGGGDGGRPLAERVNDYLHGDWIGRAGVEKLCEDIRDPLVSLRGRRGYRRVERTGRLLEELPAELGQDVHLTIDVELQRAVAAELGRPGAAVVLDVATGEVLAMVSLPTYDLNHYRRRFRALVGDTADLPLLNRAVAARYPPASTVKPVVAAAALTTGAVRPDERIACNGYLHNPEEFRCWIYKQYGLAHGPLDVVAAIEKSCNIFFYTAGQRLGLRRLNEWFARFGFADRPGTHLPEEQPGQMPDPRQVRSIGPVRYAAIGQGPVAVTPLHVANAMATIARGGEFRTPVLVRELRAWQRRAGLGVSPETIRLIQQGMDRVVNSREGTAWKHARDDEVRICGKTGTGWTPPRLDEAGHVVRSGDTLWFAGFAPYGNPQIAFAVVVEYGGGGGASTCGPIARRIVHLCRGFGYLH